MKHEIEAMIAEAKRLHSEGMDRHLDALRLMNCALDMHGAAALEGAHLAEFERLNSDGSELLAKAASMQRAAYELDDELGEPSHFAPQSSRERMAGMLGPDPIVRPGNLIDAEFARRAAEHRELVLRSADISDEHSRTHDPKLLVAMQELELQRDEALARMKVMTTVMPLDQPHSTH